jgi:hypothetical protein
MSMLALRGDRCLVSIPRAMSERVTTGPEGTSRAKTVLATMRPPAIQAKVNMEPLRIGGNGRQKIFRPTLVGEPESTMARIASILIRRLLGRVGFANKSCFDKVRLPDAYLGGMAPTTCFRTVQREVDAINITCDLWRLSERPHFQ